MEPNQPDQPVQAQTGQKAQSPPESTAQSPEREQTLFFWKSPVRPFKKRNRQFFTTVLAIAFLLSLIMFFIEGALPVAVIISIVFLVYVLSTVPPEEVEHKITERGVYIAGKRKKWEELTRFWFTRRFEHELLVVESWSFPGRLEMVINPQDKEEIRKNLEQYLPYEEAAPDFLDRTAGWFSRRAHLDESP